jgi:hypothetical protein
MPSGFIALIVVAAPIIRRAILGERRTIRTELRSSPSPFQGEGELNARCCDAESGARLADIGKKIPYPSGRCIAALAAGGVPRRCGEDGR